MMKNNKRGKLSHFAAQFPVPDVIEAAEWYRDQLGFDFTFQWGEPLDYAVTSRDDAVAIHFVKADPGQAIQPRVVYIFCHDVDAVLKSFPAGTFRRLQNHTITNTGCATSSWPISSATGWYSGRDRKY